MHLSPFVSVSSIVSHVPYIMALLSATNGKLRRAIAFGRGNVSKRLGLGANRKDLFYYLVRQHIASDMDHLIVTEHRVARSSLKPSVPLSKTLHKMGRWLLLQVQTQQAVPFRLSSTTCC